MTLTLKRAQHSPVQGTEILMTHNDKNKLSLCEPTIKQRIKNIMVC